MAQETSEKATETSLSLLEAKLPKPVLNQINDTATKLHQHALHLSKDKVAADQVRKQYLQHAIVAANTLEYNTKNNKADVKFLDEDVLSNIKYYGAKELATLYTAINKNSVSDETYDKFDAAIQDAVTKKDNEAFTDAVYDAKLSQTDMENAVGNIQRIIQENKVSSVVLQKSNDEATKALDYLNSLGIDVSEYHTSTDTAEKDVEKIDQELDKFLTDFKETFQQVYDASDDDTQTKMYAAFNTILTNEELNRLTAALGSEDATGIGAEAVSDSDDKNFGIGESEGKGADKATGPSLGDDESGGIYAEHEPEIPVAKSDSSAIGGAAIADKATAQVVELSNAAQYAAAIANEPQINHIFSNPFYNSRAVPHWAFSVDFIPNKALNDTITLARAIDLSKLLTKAILNVTLPNRELTSTVSHYKGMTIELPARAKVSGELAITFAENENCAVLRCLDALLNFARSIDYYEYDDDTAITYFNYVKELGDKMAAAGVEKASVTQEQIIENINRLQSYRQFLPNNGHQFDILIKLYKAKDTKAFYDEDVDELPSMVYFFKHCDLKTINAIDFDYSSDEPVDISCAFIYQYFEEMTYYEYALRYATMPADNANARATADQAALAERARVQNPGIFDDGVVMAESTKKLAELCDFSNSKSKILRNMFAKPAESNFEPVCQTPASMTPEGAADFISNSNLYGAPPQGNNVTIPKIRDPHYRH